MEINLEKQQPHSIQSYDTRSVTIQGKVYQNSLIVTSQKIIHPWQISNTQDLSTIIDLEPEIILIGYIQTTCSLLPKLKNICLEKKIGIECMTLGAACRTFNILINESRKVALGLIIDSNLSAP